MFVMCVGVQCCMKGKEDDEATQESNRRVLLSREEASLKSVNCIDSRQCIFFVADGGAVYFVDVIVL
jgi:hypothetical protein